MKRLFHDWNDVKQPDGKFYGYRPADWPDPMPAVGERVVLTDTGEDAWEGTVVEVQNERFCLVDVDWDAPVEDPEAFMVERVRKANPS